MAPPKVEKAARLQLSTAAREAQAHGRGGKVNVYTDAEIIKALEITRGLTYLAAEVIGCCADTVNQRVRDVPAVKEARERIREETHDTVENKLWTAAQKGEPWAVQFYLKTKARDRGYADRTEVTGAGGGPVVQSIVLLPGVARSEAEWAALPAGEPEPEPIDVTPEPS